jgi:hypothetical protein
MPTITKYAGDKVTVHAIIKNVGIDINNFSIRLKLASPHITYKLIFPSMGSFKSGTAIDWTGIFTVGSDWLSDNYTLVFVVADGEEEFQEIITDWTITIIVLPT